MLFLSKIKKISKIVLTKPSILFYNKKFSIFAILLVLASSLLLKASILLKIITIIGKIILSLIALYLTHKIITKAANYARKVNRIIIKSILNSSKKNNTQKIIHSKNFPPLNPPSHTNSKKETTLSKHLKDEISKVKIKFKPLKNSKINLLRNNKLQIKKGSNRIATL